MVKANWRHKSQRNSRWVGLRSDGHEGTKADDMLEPSLGLSLVVFLHSKPSGWVGLDFGQRCFPIPGWLLLPSLCKLTGWSSQCEWWWGKPLDLQCRMRWRSRQTATRHPSSFVLPVWYRELLLLWSKKGRMIRILIVEENPFILKEHVHIKQHHWYQSRKRILEF